MKRDDNSRNWRRRSSAVGAVLLTCWAGTLFGCAARQVREIVFSKPDITVLLRGTQSGGQPLDRGFQHPAEVAPERLAEILARVRVRKSSETGPASTPLVSLAQLPRVAAGLSAGLSAAGPGQEVVVLATRTKARFGLLRRETLTSFAVRVEGGSLHLQLGHVDWPVPVPRPERLPEPSSRKQMMDFDVIPSPGIERIASQALRVSEAALFLPLEVEVTSAAHSHAPQPSVSVVAPVAEPTPRLSAEPTAPRAADPLEQLSPAELRAIATLREARERGELAEREYRLLLDALLRPEAL